ncbi:hypothetical protein HYFRA_00012616 [Hymenoscyphus fraxineus]|uniref:Uncharacterized protein n=1 Tax=Hymenoscyphus fraxineus TaxID=746836 RepID=A0A9N9PXV6_9HELO|nr:hypothetical protein HYFRA_00012616 [Hymenoscyphus fraxineus]
MTEPYRKVGRGGAGNFYSKEDVKNVATSLTPSTLESQPLSPSTSQPAKTPQTTTQPPQEYTHTGRGGAGNWVQPSTLPPSSTDSNSTSLTPSTASSSYTPSIIPTKTPATNAATAKYKGGRGGAGNYSWTDDGDEERKREEKEREEEREMGIRMRVLGEVEGGLKVPGRAVVGREKV